MADTETLYREAGIPLADLYAAGLNLPNVSPTEDNIEIETIDMDQWWSVFNSIDRLTGSEDPYRLVFHPDEDTEIIEGPLADDLADIYHDVLPATEWTDDAHLDDLLWQLRFSFQSHWGRHALEAMKVLFWRHHRYW